MMKRMAIVVAIVIVVGPAASQEPATSEGRIKQLREQRVAVLKQIHESMLALNEQGVQGFGVEQVHQAMTRLLYARLDLAASRQDRIKIHEQLVAQAKMFLDHVTTVRNVGGGGGTQIELLKAEAQYLDAQVALEQAKAAN